MKLLAFLAFLPLCGCTSLAPLGAALNHSSYTVSFAPAALGPVQLGQVSFTVSPQMQPSK